MKKYVAVFFLVASILACGQWQSPQQLATQTAIAATATAVSWTKTPTLTPTPDFAAKLGLTGADLYNGPGENYASMGFVLGDVKIIGQAYECAWFKVVSIDNSAEYGWVSADKLTYTVKCSDVAAVEIPPTPLPTPTQKPRPTATRTRPPQPVVTRAPAAPPVTCLVNSNIRIDNRTDGPATLYLKGPGNFTFTLPLGANTVLVCSGSYNYTIYGKCGGSDASGTGRISDGDNIYFHCN